MRFDGNNDDRPDRAVYTAVCLSTRRVVLGDLSRDFALATPDATGRRALGPNACRRTVELTSETPLLPLRHVSRVCDIRENLLSRSRDLPCSS